MTSHEAGIGLFGPGIGPLQDLSAIRFYVHYFTMKGAEPFTKKAKKVAKLFRFRLDLSSIDTVRVTTRILKKKVLHLALLKFASLIQYFPLAHFA